MDSYSHSHVTGNSRYAQRWSSPGTNVSDFDMPDVDILGCCAAVPLQGSHVFNGSSQSSGHMAGYDYNSPAHQHHHTASVSGLSSTYRRLGSAALPTRTPGVISKQHRLISSGSLRHPSENAQVKTTFPHVPRMKTLSSKVSEGWLYCLPKSHGCTAASAYVALLCCVKAVLAASAFHRNYSVLLLQECCGY